MTAAQRRAAYRARRNVHPVCGIRTDGEVPDDCQVCAMVEAYRARREMYRDEVERSDKQNERETPVLPVVTFGWWLRAYEWSPVVDAEPELAGDDLAHLDAWVVTA